ncbi:MAG: FAD-dependent oxidoreductase [Clostridiales bacterium]|nr:FAD-dependent oxidoreductase [Clostridiales bacterium]
MNITIPQKSIPVRESVQVLVVGGGPAGVGAAVAAARMGMKTMLLEKRGFLGGNVTACYVETCNYFMKGTSFAPQGIAREVEEGFDREYPTDDLRPGAPHRFHSEHLKVYLDDFLRREGVQVKLHAFVNEVVQRDGLIRAVVIQTKQGPQAVEAGLVIDCTGDGDVACAAGVAFDLGRDTDHRCQPGTVSVRLAGADVKQLLADGDGLSAISRRFHREYREGKTGLPCFRQDLPLGRLTEAGIVSYVNYACSYGIDPTDMDDLTRGEQECRHFILDIVRYMKANYPGMEKIQIASMSPEIGFRDSRRIRGLYRLTIEDMEAQRHFEDCIAVYPRFYDMLTPDPALLQEGEGSVEGRGYHGHIYEPIVGDRHFEIPFRCLIPEKTDNLLVAGRCISAGHVAESGVRAISLCAMTGQAAGTAAALCLRDRLAPAQVPTDELQSLLRKAGFLIPQKEE